METMLDREDLNKVNDVNMREFLRHFVSDLFKNHKENKGYNLAFRSAIQSDKTLHEAHKQKVYDLFKIRAQNLREINEGFNIIPEESLIDVFVFAFNLINAVIFHHLSVMKLFDTDNELIEYLLNLLIYSLKYVLKT